MMRHVCQGLIVINLLAGVLLTLYRDVNGRKAEDPAGFRGVVVTLIVFVLMAAVYLGAGVFER